MWVMNMALNLDIGTCNPAASHQSIHLNNLPLPASKELWEASTSTKWEAAYHQHVTNLKGSEMPNIGDLKAAHSHGNNSALDSSKVDDLREWSSTVDEFGAMLMMAIQ